MKKTQSLRTSNGEKKSNYKFTTYPIRPKVSQRKIDNNIKEKLFQAKIHTYKVKQKVLLDNIKEIISVYKKCIQMSKQMSQPKRKYFEDVELVVDRIVEEAFGGTRVQARDTNDEQGTIKRRDAEESTAAVSTLRMSDLRVWDKRSPNDGSLNSIAGRLLVHHRRLRAEWDRLTADRERLRQLAEAKPVRSTGANHRSVDELARPLDGDSSAGGVPAVLRKRELVEIMTRIRDALTAANRENGPSVAENGGNSCCSRRLHGMTAVHESRELRKRLALVTDRLKAAEKDRRDLLGVVERSRSDPTPIESLRAVLSKEKEKNDHLQSVVDVMFTAIHRDA
ncbi:uncharacterized protein LOC114129041 [Aphis gossypii]|uniref:uncharacterized protein LOC114129041 n=1 Tax=Aphis gossypii TaxID=80765 RepID=UPI00100F0179|nr:uncharacterized protein LOC114129041 [Aphis gossypii]XP_050054862.1 uncharacterized protein LOC114129041 [Aphis gossypii]